VNKLLVENGRETWATNNQKWAADCGVQPAFAKEERWALNALLYTIIPVNIKFFLLLLQRIFSVKSIFTCRLECKLFIFGQDVFHRIHTFQATPQA
jgi:hypothetical protein